MTKLLSRRAIQAILVRTVRLLPRWLIAVFLRPKQGGQRALPTPPV